MRAIFYSPMNQADAGAASGVQRMGALLQSALRLAGVEIVRPALPRTYDGHGDGDRQGALKEESARRAEALTQAILTHAMARPDLWFSYHVYYKSPDWIGPAVTRALNIPYIIAEGSHAPKRAGGAWAIGHEGASAALGAADRILAMTRFDRVCLDHFAPGRVRDLKPFADASAYPDAARQRGEAHAHLIAVAMMGNARKRASYELLAAALRLMGDLPLKLTIAGDGEFRGEVEAMFAPAARLHDVRFEGLVPSERIAALLASGDIFAWPGLGEAYGLVFLEAQASGLAVVACNDRGVPDATRENETALLSPPGDVAAYARNLRRLVTDTALRTRLGQSARRFAHDERGVTSAAATLRRVIGELVP